MGPRLSGDQKHVGCGLESLYTLSDSLSALVHSPRRRCGWGLQVMDAETFPRMPAEVKHGKGLAHS